MSVHVSGGGALPRRIVLSCDVAGCPVQVEPSAAERWRRDADAMSWAREHADGWTHDPVRDTDYCPDHADASTPPVAGEVAPRPTRTARGPGGHPLDRDEYAARLRASMGNAGGTAGHPTALTRGQAVVVARLLDELAGVYAGEDLGALAGELARTLDAQDGSD